MAAELSGPETAFITDPPVCFGTRASIATEEALEEHIEQFQAAEGDIVTDPEDGNEGSTVPEAPTKTLDVRPLFRARFHRNGSIDPAYSVVLVAPRVSLDRQMQCLLQDATGEPGMARQAGWGGRCGE